MVGYREAATVTSWLITILVLNILFQCVYSAAPRQSTTKKTMQDKPKDNMDDKEQSSLAAGPETEKTEDKPQMDDPHVATTISQNNDVDHMPAKMTTQVPMKTSTPANGVTPMKGGSMANKNATNSSKIKDESEMMRCNSTKDCAAYMGAECMRDTKDNKTRCLCGNLTVPKNASTCKEVHRYVKFPCQEDAHCVQNAQCASRADAAQAKAALALASTPTSNAKFCWCKPGFEPTTDNSLCLDDVGRLRMAHETDFSKVQRLLKNLQKDQLAVKQRLRMLENSSTQTLPSAALLLLGAWLSMR